MTWRIILITIAAFAGIIWYDTVNYVNDQDTAMKLVISIPLLILVCSIVVLVSSWKAAKLRFAQPSPVNLHSASNS
jgi:hypothetical protein